MKIECAEDCGNSPKKKLLKELSIAFANNDIDFCVNCVTDDVVWDIVGDRLIQGKDLFEQALRQLKDRKVEQLRILNIITHGNVGSVNGTIVLSDLQHLAFCDVYNFRGFGKNSKIKTITSYVIGLRIQ